MTDYQVKGLQILRTVAVRIFSNRKPILSVFGTVRLQYGRTCTSGIFPALGID